MSAAEQAAPRSLRDLLLAVRAEAGELTPSTVLAAARPPESPLHSRFEWDDSVAAEKHRLEQAHRLIVKVRVTFTDSSDEQRQVRAFVAVPGPERVAPAYHPTEEVALDPVARQIVLGEAERWWRMGRRRYGHLVEFLDLVRADVLGEDAAGTG